MATERLTALQWVRRHLEGLESRRVEWAVWAILRHLEEQAASVAGQRESYELPGLLDEQDAVEADLRKQLEEVKAERDRLQRGLDATVAPHSIEGMKRIDNSFWVGNQEVTSILTPELAGYFERAIGYYQDAGKNGLREYVDRAEAAEAKYDTALAALDGLDKNFNSVMAMAGVVEKRWWRENPSYWEVLVLRPKEMIRAAISQIKGKEHEHLENIHALLTEWDEAEGAGNG